MQPVLTKVANSHGWVTSALRSASTAINDNCLRPFDAIPAPKAKPLIGTLWDVYRAGGVSQIHRYIDERHCRLGPIFRERLGHVEAVWVNDAQLFRQVYQCEGSHPQPMLPEPWLIYNRKRGCQRGLFFMQGEEWAKYRKMIAPMLLKSATLDRHIEGLNEIADQLLESWSRYDGRVVEHLENDLYTYFVQGLMCAAFGPEVALDSNTWNALIPEMVSNLQALFQNTARLTLFPPSLAARWGLAVWNEFESSAQRSLQLAGTLSEMCMERVTSQGCLVASLRENNVSPHDIRRIVTDLFLAAADTTSHTMQWVLYSLGRNPAVQDRVADECRRSIELAPTAADRWQQMPLMKGSVREALRLYPVAPFLTRILPDESQIGDYQIPAGTLVLLSTYSSGRDPRYFVEPQRFWPERWTRETSEKSVTDPYASLPFGHGKRSCVGRRLAEAQMYMFLCKVLPAFRLYADQQVEMIMRLLGTVDQPVRLRLQRR